MPDQMVIQRPFLHDFPTGHVDENGIFLHAAKLGGADQAVGRTGEGRTDQQNCLKAYRLRYINRVWTFQRQLL